MGATRRNTIQLNGKHYDSQTGASVQQTRPANTPKQLDGFSRRRSPTTAAPTMTTRPTPKPAAVHSRTEKAKTLMRKSVKKPAQAPKIHAKTSIQTPVPIQPNQQTPKITAITPGRALRATNIMRSSLISKFGSLPAAFKTEQLPVKPAPHHTDAPHHKPSTADAPHTHTEHAKTQATSHHNKHDPFARAIERAHSHEQKQATHRHTVKHRVARKLKVSPGVVNFAAITLVAVLLGSFLAYQNIPELSMRYAAAKAGFNANLPSYQPSGFQMSGPIEYKPGEISLTYKSNSDARQFNVIQKSSAWNSDTLLQHVTTSDDSTYQTFQANGRTIYIFADNQATWVDGGVWYTIDGKSSLNSDQILRIANSL